MENTLPFNIHYRPFTDVLSFCLTCDDVYQELSADIVTQGKRYRLVQFRFAFDFGLWASHQQEWRVWMCERFIWGYRISVLRSDYPNTFFFWWPRLPTVSNQMLQYCHLSARLSYLMLMTFDPSNVGYFPRVWDTWGHWVPRQRILLGLYLFKMQ